MGLPAAGGAGRCQGGPGAEVHQGVDLLLYLPVPTCTYDEIFLTKAEQVRRERERDVLWLLIFLIILPSVSSVLFFLFIFHFILFLYILFFLILFFFLFLLNFLLSAPPLSSFSSFSPFSSLTSFFSYLLFLFVVYCLFLPFFHSLSLNVS